MLAALICLTILLALAILALAALTVRSRLMPGPPMIGRTIVVHTRRPDDQTLRGVLVAEHADRISLCEVVYVHSSGERAVDTPVHVPRENVAWLQEIDR